MIDGGLLSGSGLDEWSRGHGVAELRSRLHGRRRVHPGEQGITQCDLPEQKSASGLNRACCRGVDAVVRSFIDKGRSSERACRRRAQSSHTIAFPLSSSSPLSAHATRSRPTWPARSGLAAALPNPKARGNPHNHRTYPLCLAARRNQPQAPSKPPPQPRPLVNQKPHE